MQSKTIWTIGHSTHPIEEFVELLKSQQIEHLVDVRSLPGSRKFPQFNKENLMVSMPENDIQYSLIPELGGRRKKKPDSKNTAWHNLSFRNYADYMETDEFKEGIEQLIKLAKKQRVCYMCSEAVWWRCHRSMISDYLKVNGWEVLHIMSLTTVTEHPYTSPAKVVNGMLSYQE